MSSDIPEWVRLDCRAWGHQKRRIWSGSSEWYLNATGERCRHVDGYAQSLLGRIRDEREGAAQGIQAQRWAEVFWGGGLDVQRTLTGMPERQFYALHFQYVWDPEWGMTASRKARHLGIGRTEYFALIEKGETWIHARLEASTALADSQLVERVNEIVRGALRGTSGNATKAQLGRSAPREALNFSALNRPKLSVSS